MCSVRWIMLKVVCNAWEKTFKYVICGDPPFKVGELATKWVLYKLVHLIDLIMYFIFLLGFHFVFLM